MTSLQDRFISKNGRRLTMDCGVTTPAGSGKVVNFGYATGEVVVELHDGSIRWYYAEELSTEHGVNP